MCFGAAVLEWTRLGLWRLTTNQRVVQFSYTYLTTQFRKSTTMYVSTFRWRLHVLTVDHCGLNFLYASRCLLFPMIVKICKDWWNEPLMERHYHNNLVWFHLIDGGWRCFLSDCMSGNVAWAIFSGLYSLEWYVFHMTSTIYVRWEE